MRRMGAAALLLAAGAVVAGAPSCTTSGPRATSTRTGTATPASATSTAPVPTATPPATSTPLPSISPTPIPSISATPIPSPTCPPTGCSIFVSPSGAVPAGATLTYDLWFVAASTTLLTCFDSEHDPSTFNVTVGPAGAPCGGNACGMCLNTGHCWTLSGGAVCHVQFTVATYANSASGSTVSCAMLACGAGTCVQSVSVTIQ